MSLFDTLAVIVVAVPGLVILSFPLHVGWFFRRTARGQPPDDVPSKVSVIVPCKGVDETASENLAALLGQRSSGEMEFLLCVEDAGDPVLPIVEKCISASTCGSARIVVTGAAQHALGKTHNLLGGLAEATGDRLILLDSDVQLDDPRYLERFVADLDRPKVGLVTGFPAYRGARNLAAGVTAMMINNDLLGLFALLGTWGTFDVANGSCMAIRRETLDALGGLTRLENQLLMDTVLARAIVHAGCRVHLHHRPAPVVRRLMSWREWWQQAHRWQVAMWHVLPHHQYMGFCWMRSAGFAGALILFGSLEPRVGIALGLFLLARVFSAWRIDALYVENSSFGRYILMLPLIEMLNAVTSIGAMFVSTVTWRGARYRVADGGAAVKISGGTEIDP